MPRRRPRYDVVIRRQVALLLLDSAIAVDFAIWGGRHTLLLVTIANLGLIVAAVGVALRPQATAEPSALRRADQSATPEDVAIASRVASLLSETGLHREPDLTLSRLARRMGLPTRTLSQAINRVHGVSISRYVNVLRITEAAALLKSTDWSVADIMEHTGFLSRSNFYLEFQRVHGIAPAEFRSHVDG